MARAVTDAGARAVVPLGAHTGARAALRHLDRRGATSLAVEVLADCDLDPSELPVGVDTVLLAAGTVADAATLERWRGAPGAPEVVVEVTSHTEALEALEAGCDALVAKGAEAGGRVGETAAFILLQQCVELGDTPVLVRGGIGEHTAAAAIAGGAAGVVLDVQVALYDECLGLVPEELRRVLHTVDGSETRVVGGHRLYARPDLEAATMAEDTPAEAVVARLGAAVGTDLVPLGQDAHLAAVMARRHPTLHRLVTTLGAPVDERIRMAAEQGQLGPASAFAAHHGLGVPVAQGPMTRVSDRAEFAGSVAEGGGLPFLALSLMRGDECRALLETTRDLLGDRTWGAGILGFVPPELREEQLAALLEVRPRVALIAGGRPSQAASLEAAGIATFLHVPSPGLLAQFLKDGARRFVLEGRECGGHVGPRTSFVLWEQQVECLLAHAAAQSGDEPLGDVDVLFAGGIHDERSAAMVAALAQPLVASGARFGVLMGSAYLFTREVVADGAIRPTFQAQAIGCDRTVLFETAPGHATRGADGDFVRRFLDRKAELVAADTAPSEMWAELEQLNLGRLRIASKGLVRDTDGLREVDDDIQRREGMFMLGDVATLRHEVTTIAELHHQVGRGGAEHLARRADRLATVVTEPDTDGAAPLDVAIVGMACFLPGASDPEAFWSNVVRGVDSVTEVPASRWDTDLYFDPDHRAELAGRKTPSKWGGFVPEVRFDALGYGIPPRSLASIEPVQLLALEAAARALADAGYDGGGVDRSRISVIFGAEAGNDLGSTYGVRALLPTYLGELPSELDDQLPSLTEDSFPGILANVITGRIANRLDLGGANYTVDAACASSLSAVDAACKELAAGSSDMVLCGGADLHNGIADYLAFSSVHALSPTGRCRTFDAGADGIAISEGVACVVLKRLADAERDGDHVHAVIRSVAASSDGRHLGLTAPRQEGQRLAVERAYRRAGVSPAEVGLVEAHGTGTVVGDRTELSTLARVFADEGAAERSCALGSAKSNIGHTKCAAGLAGLIKAALAVERGVRPPTLHVDEPNSAYFDHGAPFRLPGVAEPWVAKAPSERIAGISAFGFGGTNYHTVVTGHGSTEPEHGVAEWPAEVFVVRGRDRAEAAALLTKVADHVRSHVDAGIPPRLRDLAATVAETGRGPVQVAVVATDLDDLVARIEDAVAFRPVRNAVMVADPDATVAGQVAWCFPGQGSQRVGMLADLFVTFPALRTHLVAGAAWADVLFPARAFGAESVAAQQAAITDTRVAQPVLGMADLAMADLLGDLGVRCDLAGGHSYGELVALTVAGAIRREDLLELSQARGEAILDAAGDDTGAMAAVGADAATVTATLEATSGTDGVVVANHNSPQQSVISGPSPAVDAAVAALSAAGVAATSLPVACAFHSGVVAGAADSLRRRLDELEITAPTLPVYANVTAAPYGDDVRELLAAQVAAPVRWTEQIQAMYDAGARVFIEVGPGAVLTRLVDQILDGRPHVAVACNPGGDGLVGLLRAVATLAAAGVEVDLDALFGSRARCVDLRAPAPTGPMWTVDGHLVRGPDGAPVAGGLRPADEVTRMSLDAAAASPAVANPAAVDHTVLAYLQGMRELVAAQRDVMLAALGRPPGPAVTSSEVITPLVAPVSIGSPAPAGTTAGVSERPTTVTPTATATPGASLDAGALTTAVLDVVAERTGYPLDMLDPDLDLEADLSIDSIKRIEILGELSERIDLAAGDDGLDDSVVEELAQIKTIRGIVTWIIDRAAATNGSPARGAENSTNGTGASGGSVDDTTPVEAFVAHRYDIELIEVDVPRADPSSLAGTCLVVVDGGDVATALAERMTEAGATTVSMTADDAGLTEAVAAADGLVDLRALDQTSHVDAVSVFPEVRAAALGGARLLVAATAMGGTLGRPAMTPGAAASGPTLPAGAGIAGLLRTVQREHPELRCRAVDLDPSAPPHEQASALFDEITVDDPHVTVGRTGTRRIALRAQRHGDGPPRSRDPLRLDGDSVVVVTGGGRGITARVALALAAESGCHLVLLGRTPPPGDDEPAELMAATDDLAIRRHLIDTGVTAPRDVEAALRRIKAERELRDNLGRLGSAAASVDYRSVDVRDESALRDAMAATRQQHGRVDLVVHGAGVLDDRLIRDKTLDGFRSVYETKVGPAVTLAADLAAHSTADHPAALVLFGSVSGVFGNRGQCDYSAANDALDLLSWRLATHPHLSVVSVDWGPWGGEEGGMVTAELEREYARRGIGMLGTDDAVAHLFDALGRAEPPSQLLVMAGSADVFDPLIYLTDRSDPNQEGRHERAGV